MNNRLDISVVVPLYNEQESLSELVAWIDRVARENTLSYEVIMVDDGSSDDSWQVVKQLNDKYPAIKGIRFARNYGKSAALYCGFAEAEGEVVFTMDADLQDSPDEIPDDVAGKIALVVKKRVLFLHLLLFTPCCFTVII